MSGRNLLLVSLGPVQDFIAQARRSRDLWFGSHLLSELSRAAARCLAGEGGRLIFPALRKGDAELAPCDEPTRPNDESPVSVANKILAELGEGIEPEACAKAAREAVLGRWRGIAERVRRERAPVLADNINPVWCEHVEDVIEFYAVWARLDRDYRAARRAVEQALAGRKNLRDFRAWQHDRAGAPKSSLDGARVSVLGADRHGAEFGRLRISAGEQLDAIGLIKRAGFEPEQFVPLVNIAAGPWLQQAEGTAPAEIAALREACRQEGIPSIRRNLPVVEPFRFDASVLYPSRWPALFKELDRPLGPTEARAWGEKHVRPLLKRMGGEPPAYVACLHADGDKMGPAIDSLATAEANRTFSQELAKFPRDAREIVERDHRGSLIYAGGDDVLGFLPVATAPACAAALAQAFRERLAMAMPGDLVPTLSVGIAVGHVIEPMSLLLDLARQAERAAKDAGRNALAIIVDKRSGGKRRVALKWDCSPLERLRRDADLLEGPLSIGKVYELETMRRRFPRPDQVTQTTEAAAALAAYATGILAHTGDSAVATLSAIGVEPNGDYDAFSTALAAAVDRILLIRSLREWGFR